MEQEPLSESKAAYTAGYITKKMTDQLDPRLGDREPEFATMSLKPGLGVEYIKAAARSFKDHELSEVMIDVPTMLQHGRKMYPLGSYLRRLLRKEVYGTDEPRPQVYPDEVQDMREAAQANPATKNFLQMMDDLVSRNSNNAYGKIKLERRNKL